MAHFTASAARLMAASRTGCSIENCRRAARTTARTSSRDLSIRPASVSRFAVALSTIAFLFVNAAQAGLTSALGQRNVMSGQVATVWNIVQALPVLGSYWLGGVFSDLLDADAASRHNLFTDSAAALRRYFAALAGAGMAARTAARRSGT